VGGGGGGGGGGAGGGMGMGLEYCDKSSHGRDKDVPPLPPFDAGPSKVSLLLLCLLLLCIVGCVRAHSSFDPHAGHSHV